MSESPCVASTDSCERKATSQSASDVAVDDSVKLRRATDPFDDLFDALDEFVTQPRLLPFVPTLRVGKISLRFRAMITGKASSPTEDAL